MKIIVHFSEDVRIDTGQHFNVFDILKQNYPGKEFHHVSKKGIKRISIYNSIYTVLKKLQYKMQMQNFSTMHTMFKTKDKKELARCFIHFCIFNTII